MENNNEKISTWLIVLNGVLVVFVVFLVFIIYSTIHPKTLTQKTEIKKVVTDSTLFNDIVLNAKAVYVFDVVNQKVIFQKNETSQLPLASITKLMTALVATNLVPKNSHITIRKEFLTAEGDSGLLANETWQMKDLLDFSLVVSSNDGARSVASVVGAIINKTDNYSLGRAEFIKQMNLETKKLGLNQTYFVNESGLDESSNQSGGYGTAEDVSKLVEYMITHNPEILESTKYSNPSISSLTKKHSAENTNTVINKIPGLIASKTGYTSLAGGNLVIAFDSSIGHPIIVVVLGSTQEGRFADVESLAKASMKYVQQNY